MPIVCALAHFFDNDRIGFLFQTKQPFGMSYFAVLTYSLDIA